MSWGKVDDALHDHPKVDALLERDERSGLAAMGLWTLVFSCVSGQLTDGAISQRVVRRIAPDNGMELAAWLVSNGLWEVDGEGWVMHDYLDHNESRATILKRRESRAAAGRRGGKASGEKRRTAANAEAVASPGATANAVAQAEAPGLNPRPDPTRPVVEGVGAGAPHLEQGISDEHTSAVVAVLRTAPRLVFDPLLAGVTNVLAAYPNVDHVQAAHIAVSNSADPTYRTTDAAKALRYAIQDLARQAPQPRGAAPKPAVKPKPWAGALRSLVDDTTEAA